MKWKPRLGFSRSDAGGVAIEFAIVSSLFILGCVAALDFGRALYVRNEMSYAADIAERVILIDPDIPEDELHSTLQAAFRGDPDQLTVELGEETVDGVDFRTLTLTYPFTLFVPHDPSRELNLSVSRRTPLNNGASGGSDSSL